jgi:hypothetical protein
MDGYGTARLAAKDAESAIVARICEDFNLTPVLARARRGIQPSLVETARRGQQVVSLTERRLTDLPGNDRPLPSATAYDDLLGKAGSGPGRRPRRRCEARFSDQAERVPCFHPRGRADDKQLSKTIARYGRVDPLCLDELGDMELDRCGAELLFQVLTEREERAAIAIASNGPFSGWTTIFTTRDLAPPSSTDSPSPGRSSRPAPPPTGWAHARERRAAS